MDNRIQTTKENNVPEEDWLEEVSYEILYKPIFMRGEDVTVYIKLEKTKSSYNECINSSSLTYDDFCEQDNLDIDDFNNDVKQIIEEQFPEKICTLNNWRQIGTSHANRMVPRCMDRLYEGNFSILGISFVVTASFTPFMMPERDFEGTPEQINANEKAIALKLLREKHIK